MKTSNGTKVCKRKFKDIPGMSQDWKDALGEVKEGFRLIVWGRSGSGKSNFVFALAAQLLDSLGVGLYLSLEERQGPTLQKLLDRWIPEDKKPLIRFPDVPPTYEELIAYLKKPRTPQWIVIDSIQYFDFRNEKRYKELEAALPKKNFIFVSHSVGKEPDGRVALKIRYDAGIKVLVKEDIAFIQHSRYGGNKNFVIWEPGARASRSDQQYKDDLFRHKVAKPKNQKAKGKPAKPVVNEPDLFTQ